MEFLQCIHHLTRGKMEKADKLHKQTTQQNAKNVLQDNLKAKQMRQLALNTLFITFMRGK